ncbi:MAG: segregation and condensation protein A [Anaerolineaceae bacterium]|jgi:segregation and condensation protein A
MSRPWSHLDSYEIETEVYAGPLDLLLDLIQKAELDITKLALAQVTDQFLAYVERKREKDPESISEFLVIASKLIQIKSGAMLPRSPIHEEDEEDLGEALAQQLLIYREVRNTSHWLADRTDAKLRGYLHVAKTYPISIQADLTGIEITDLINALENMLIDSQAQSIDSTISIPKLTLRNKVQEILKTLQINQKATFHSLVGQNSTRLNTIVVFLAILELVKQNLILTEQTSNFSDIQIIAQESLYKSPISEFSIDD